MTADLMEEVRQFLPALEATQTELAALYEDKLRATRTADAGRMLTLADVEADLVKRLEGHIEHRGRILERARQSGLACDSIQSLVATAGADALRKRIDDAKTRSNRLRSASWVQWIASQRALLYYAELIELIAQCGDRSPTYGPAARDSRSGGALLDATA